MTGTHNIVTKQEAMEILSFPGGDWTEEEWAARKTECMANGYFRIGPDTFELKSEAEK